MAASNGGRGPGLGHSCLLHLLPSFAIPGGASIAEGAMPPRSARYRFGWPGQIGSRRIVAFALAAALAGCATTGIDIPQSDHYAGGRFHNIGAFVEPAATREDWRQHNRRLILGLFPDADNFPPGHVLTPEAARAGVARAENAQLAVTWIGHATTLIRLGDQWVLTDPALTEDIGPGPVRVERLVPPRPGIADLPPIDIIVISHADYDHLDVPSLRRLAWRNPDTTVYVPLGTGPLVRLAGFRDVHELDWFQSAQHGDVTVETVPAIHGVRRPPYGLNSMLWAGWILEVDGTRVYFAGDTGFGSVFADIRRRSGPVDVALVPIGAWSPRWFQESFHVSPDQALEIAGILGARTAIGIHWGTFPLSEEAPIEQRRRFLAAAGHGVRAIVPRIGETLILRSGSGAWTGSD